LPAPVQAGGSSYFKYQRLAFEKAGFRSGLSMQALPYDFRKDYRESDLNGKFGRVLTELNKNTGKKVVIIAHSFGNLQTVYQLSKKTQSWKDATIARYIAIAPPYMGSTFLASSMIGYHASYMVYLYITSLGIDPQMFKNSLANSQGVINLLPRDVFKKNASQPWMKDIFKRIEAERAQKSMPRGTIFDFLPQPTEKCVSGFTDKNDFCDFDFYDYNDIGFVNGENITPSTMGRIFDKYGVLRYGSKFISKNYDALFDQTLTNPGVQTTILYSNVVKTPKKFTFSGNPKP
jgi:hypothetical protein